jgi:pimeloyl-ACP methyl ester carboxylesterase
LNQESHLPYVHNQDVKIYYEIEGQGPSLLFAHGATGNMNSWRRYGYVDKFKNDYTVIPFDMRDHNHVNANTNLDVIVPNVRDFLVNVQ